MDGQVFNGMVPVSNPPPGCYKVCNIFVTPNGDLVVQYGDGPGQPVEIQTMVIEPKKKRDVGKAKGWVHQTEKMTKLSNNVLKAGPLATPQRRGLLWNGQSHRWVKPPRPASLRGHHLSRHARQLGPMSRTADRHLDEADSPEKARAARYAHRSLRRHRRAVHHEQHQRRVRKAYFGRVSKMGARKQGPEELGLDWCPEHERWEHPDQTRYEEKIGPLAAVGLGALGSMVSNSVAKQARDPFAVATWQAQQMGYSDFSEGSPGRAKRDEIAEGVKGVKGERKMVRRKGQEGQEGQEGTEVLAALGEIKARLCR